MTEHEMAQFDMHMAMTEDERLVVSCPQDQVHCCWAATMETSWQNLLDVTAIMDVVEPHLLKAHDQIERIDREAVIETNRFVTGDICMMKAEMAALRTDSCWALQMCKGDQESDGVVKFTMRQRAAAVGEVEQFDQWWKNIEEHAAEHSKRKPMAAILKLSEDDPLTRMLERLRRKMLGEPPLEGDEE